MPTVGILYTLPWVAVYIRLVKSVCIWLPTYGDYMIYFMRGLSAVVRFCDMGNAKAYGLWNGQRERTHAFCFLRANMEKLKSNCSDIWVLSEKHKQ